MVAKKKKEPSMDEILSNYTPGKEIARGAFATVFSCTKKSDGYQYALKLVDKAKGEGDLDGETRVKFLLAEVEILEQLRHPHIVAFQQFFELPNAYALVMELVPGGELFDRIVERETYSEANARQTIRILLETIAYTHSSNVCHRDLKPENLVLESATEDTRIKLIDFGLAKRVQKDREMRTMCGTPEYCSPELLKGFPYKMSTDVFAVGVIAFILLGGYHPFKRYRAKTGQLKDDHNRVVRRICRGSFEFHKEFFEQVSLQAKDIITKMLDLNADKRITCLEALDHPWFDEDAAPMADMEGRDLTKSLIEFRTFNMKRKFRSSIQSIVLTNRINKQLNRMASAAGDGAERVGDMANKKPSPDMLTTATGTLLAPLAIQRNTANSASAAMHEMLKSKEEESSGGPTSPRPIPGAPQKKSPRGGSGMQSMPPNPPAVRSTLSTTDPRVMAGKAALDARGSSQTLIEPDPQMAALTEQLEREKQLRKEAEARWLGTQRAASMVVTQAREGNPQGASAVGERSATGGGGFGGGVKSRSSTAFAAGTAALGGSDLDLDEDDEAAAMVDEEVNKILKGKGDPALERILDLESKLAAIDARVQKAERGEGMGGATAAGVAGGAAVAGGGAAREIATLQAKLDKAMLEIDNLTAKNRRSLEQVAAYKEAAPLAEQLYKKLAVATGQPPSAPPGNAMAREGGGGLLANCESCCPKDSARR